ncbi:MAG: protein-glutamate O-methyltransferase CheR [Pseudomonadota bacterium]
MTTVLSDHSFVVLQDYLAATCGLVLPVEKSYLLNAKLQQVIQRHHFIDLNALAGAIRCNRLSPPVAQDVIDAMMINETSFFRDGQPFDAFRDTFLPALIQARQQQKKLRIWSAACAAGQEPYSLAMILAGLQDDLRDWQVDIVASDICSTVLAQAKRAMYSQFEVQRGLSPQFLDTFFKPVQSGWQLSPHIASMVQFQALNLLHPFNWLGQFDLIFCRNVLIYFNESCRANILERLHAQLAPDGYLLLGGAETTRGLTKLFKPDMRYYGVFRPV